MDPACRCWDLVAGGSWARANVLVSWLQHVQMEGGLLSPASFFVWCQGRFLGGRLGPGVLGSCFNTSQLLHFESIYFELQQQEFHVGTGVLHGMSFQT